MSGEPMVERWLRQARRAGEAAGWAKRPHRECNPYRRGTKQAQAWCAGLVHALARRCAERAAEGRAE